MQKHPDYFYGLTDIGKPILAYLAMIGTVIFLEIVALEWAVTQ